jgi:SAM-dependent methyltransferase
MKYDSQRLQDETRCYTQGVDHYLSASRHDGVKTHWEQPFTRGVFKHAIDCIAPEGPLRLLDLGSGTGDGLSLLTTMLREDPAHRRDRRFEYVGLDLNPDMVTTARRLHAQHPNVRFISGDMREAVPDHPFDLYLSCGVPYSHLTRPELRRSLKNIFSAVRRNRTRSAVVVDVLGRYSIEWPCKWPLERWMYRMSFFSTDSEMPPTEMSVYSADDLGRLVRQAADDANCNLTDIEFFDRSVMVGRHTTTGEYNPATPQYRTLVNSLIDPSRQTELSQLLFDVPPDDAPVNVMKFFKRFSVAWNALIAEAVALCGESYDTPKPLLHPRIHGLTAELESRRSTSNGADFRSAVAEPTLAEYLRRLETTTQPGLGVGHSLTAIAYLEEDLVQ